MFRALRSIWNHARRTSNLSEPPTVAIEWYDEQPDGRIIDDLLESRDTVDGLENPIHAAYLKAARQAIDGLGNSSTLHFYLQKGIRNPEIDPFNC